MWSGQAKACPTYRQTLTLAGAESDNQTSKTFQARQRRSSTEGPAREGQEALMETRARIAGAVVVFCPILFSGCAASGQKSGTAEAPPATVMVVDVQPMNVPLFSEFAAQTYARNTVEVRGRVEGYIDKWLFQPGSEVRAGQVLYVLDLRPYEAAPMGIRVALCCRSANPSWRTAPSIRGWA